MNRRFFIRNSVAFAITSTGIASLYIASGNAATLEKVNVGSSFPYELFEVKGNELADVWKKLQTKPDVTPIILGQIINFKRIADNVASLGEGNARKTKIKMTVTAANYLQHPESIFKLQQSHAHDAKEKYAKKIAHLEKKAKDETKNLLNIFKKSVNEASIAELGTWPKKTPAERKFNFSHFVDPASRAYIALIPTKDQSEIPAYLGFGGWGSCPGDEYHVSALRSWKKRYGAELISLGSDSLQLRVQKRPGSKEEAIALAKEQYAYCKHIVDPTSTTLSDLAASLMQTDEWFFWWE